MANDHPGPMTLAIVDCPLSLRVLGFSGREALNEPWHLDIDLVSSDPHLDLNALLQRQGCFTPGSLHPGIVGDITNAAQVYAGTCLSLYRLSLGPRLQRLAQPLRQRVFVGLSALQIIRQLLVERGFAAQDYRFEQLCGVYPVRTLCTQHHESDLGLLQRLCEEEGIHFRFDGQQVVFSDDSASFPERAVALRFSPRAPVPGCIDYLAEQHGLQPLHSITSYRITPHSPAQVVQGLRHDDRWHTQQSARRLERLRCESRTVTGSSADPTLLSGQVIHVTGHPEHRLNDHWLLTWIKHAGRQPAVLEGHDPHDIAAIARHLPAMELPAMQQDAAAPEHQDYRNHFGVIAWTHPFRPSIHHPKPCAIGLQPATLMGSDIDSRGHLPIRLDWQIESLTPDAWPRALLLRNSALVDVTLNTGDRVQVGYLGDDPDCPVICALLSASAAQSPPELVLDGHPVAPGQDTLTVQAGQQLHIRASDGLALQSAQGHLSIKEQSITAQTGNRLALDHRRYCMPVRDVELDDLRLTIDGAPLNKCVWYIVRMTEPGLEHLSRLNPEHFLFEGRTDEQGNLGLSKAQRRRLAMEYARTPRHLCLIHPGRCVTLRQHLRQSVNEDQYQAWLQGELNSP